MIDTKTILELSCKTCEHFKPNVDATQSGRDYCYGIYMPIWFPYFCYHHTFFKNLREKEREDSK